MEFRYYQREAIDATFDYLHRKQGNPVIGMPTGTGKSAVIGGIASEAIGMYPQTRIIMATHVKELIKQNAKTVLRINPSLRLGIYSAGLGQKDTHQPVIYGGIKSIINNLDAFGKRHLMLVDEAHLINPKQTTSYQVAYNHFKALNPQFRVILFTATPYRMGQGLLTSRIEEPRTGRIVEPLATDFAYDITGLEAFNRLVFEGYLSPLISFGKDIGIDLSNVGMSNSGDFSEAALAEATDQDRITRAGIEYSLQYASNRRAWLLFATSVKHSENIAAMLRGYGISAAAIHSELSKGERDSRIEAFKRGQLRCLVNMNVLTTGFDFPPIDFIGMFRATMSTGLWVQMLGRGTRPYDPYNPGEVDPRIFPEMKYNCLVLDFAGNAGRLGPINDPVVPRARGKGPGGPPPLKICDNCSADNHISVRFCVACGAEFSFEVKIKETAYTDDVMSGASPIVETEPVNAVFYIEHFSKKTNTPILRVEYHCGLNRYSEFVWFGGTSPMARRGRDWWRMRHDSEPPESVEEARKLSHQLKKPIAIRVWTNKKPYPEVLTAEFDAWAASASILGENSDQGWAIG